MNVVNVVPLTPWIMHLPTPAEPHVTVLRREVVEALAPHVGGVYLDATLGAGGHAAAILEHDHTTVVGVDRDRGALELAERRLARHDKRFVARHGCFSELEAVLADLAIERVDGIVADLGVSTMQLDEPARGMSFRESGPIDMRMDRSRGETALELVTRLDDDALAEIILRYGEERRARRVARCIKQALERDELRTTLDLRRAVVRAVGPSRQGGVDPATRTFQALRIAVNDELREIETLLDAAARLLVPGGTLAVISFHSLEDRMVKRAFAAHDLWQPLAKKPVLPSAAECEENPRARSAKLRAARRQPLTLVASDGAPWRREAGRA